MSALTLSEIWIYPIKSLGGIRLTQSQVMPKGLANDRRWMLIDKEGVFLTQRVHPRMALFHPTINNGQLSVAFSNESKIDISDQLRSESTKATIWNDTVDVHLHADDNVHEWFSKHLGFLCQLVSFPEANDRLVDPHYSINDEHVSLADAYPFMIIGQRSLDLLNDKLKEPVPMNRFRPNFVFTGGDAHEEDQWREFTIGTNRFAGVKLCARCVLTTVNQDTAEKGIEPLYTLSTYRKVANKVLFGQNLVALDHGIVKVGDRISVISKTANG